VKLALMIAGIALTLLALSLQRYQLTTTNTGAFKLDRLTGRVWHMNMRDKVQDEIE
jgi:hypothetical protein